MTGPTRNILADIPELRSTEAFDTLVQAGTLRIERIVSRGHTTPDGQWYDQEQHEWVLVLSGSADLLFGDEAQPRRLGPGDAVLIPARCRHRVSWTDPEQPTVWLAVHYTAEQPG